MTEKIAFMSKVE